MAQAATGPTSPAAGHRTAFQAMALVTAVPPGPMPGKPWHPQGTHHTASTSRMSRENLATQWQSPFLDSSFKPNLLLWALPIMHPCQTLPGFQLLGPGWAGSSLCVLRA